MHRGPPGSTRANPFHPKIHRLGPHQAMIYLPRWGLMGAPDPHPVLPPHGPSPLEPSSKGHSSSHARSALIRAAGVRYGQFLPSNCRSGVGKPNAGHTSTAGTAMAGDHTLSYSDTPGGYVPGGYLSIPRNTSPGTRPGESLPGAPSPDYSTS